MAYATKDELDTFIVGGVISINAFISDDEVTAVLADASRDIDRYVGPAWAFEDDGSRFGDLSVNAKDLEPAAVIALRRATCAQAEYRLAMGPDFFRQDQYETANGPDFSTTGTVGRIGVRAREELRWSGLVQAVGGQLRS